MTTNSANLPETQHAVQLVGPGELKLNRVEVGADARAARDPRQGRGGRAVLFRFEAAQAVPRPRRASRKWSPASRQTVLAGMQSYVPGNQPVVPGHEVVCRIVAVGDQVKQHQVGERCLVQTDYRQLPTAAGSNAAFGYNFDGGLQEYTLRRRARGDRARTASDFLIPVGEERSASAIALVEPWACVEDSYVTRRTKSHQGRRATAGRRRRRSRKRRASTESYSPDGEPAEVRTVSPAEVGQPAQRIVRRHRLLRLRQGDDRNAQRQARARRHHQSRARRQANRRAGVGRRRPRSLRRDALDRHHRRRRRRVVPQHSRPTAKSGRTIACSSSAPAGRWGRCT